MKEKLRFRSISKLRITETEEYQKEVQKNSSKLIKDERREPQHFELSIYDISFEQISLQTEFKALNTVVKEVAIKQTTSPLFNTPLTKQIIKPSQIPATDLIQVSAPKETLKIADIKLSAAKIEQFLPPLNTNIVKNIQMDKTKIESPVSLDLELESKICLLYTSPSPRDS